MLKKLFISLGLVILLSFNIYATPINSDKVMLQVFDSHYTTSDNNTIQNLYKHFTYFGDSIFIRTRMKNRLIVDTFYIFNLSKDKAKFYVIYLKSEGYEPKAVRKVEKKYLINNYKED